jgi:hypothetical protein
VPVGGKGGQAEQHPEERHFHSGITCRRRRFCQKSGRRRTAKKLGRGPFVEPVAGPACLSQPWRKLAGGAILFN